MNELILTLKDFKLLKILSLNKLIVLKLLFNKETELFKELFKIGENTIQEYTKDLENHQYIKILGTDYGSVDNYAIRVKTEELFKEEVDSIKDIITYLNLRLGKTRGYSYKGANKKFITGRFSEGYSSDDLKSVIDFKVKEWRGTNMEEYLRPETLFNATKFQGYFVQAGKVNSMNTFKVSNE